MTSKIIAFPFAGGNKYSFNLMKKNITSNIVDFEVLEYPGRGKRMSEPFLSEINALADDAFRRLCQEVEEEDYLIYGHSLGGLVAYLVCVRLEQKGLRKPLKLIVTGTSAPSMQEKEIIHGLSSEAFWGKIKEYGGLPEDFLKDPSLQNFFEPILRADFQAIENYQFQGNANLSIPIDVFYGSEESIEESDVKDWALESSREVNIRELAGDHFFIFEHPVFFGKYFSNQSLHS